MLDVQRQTYNESVQDAYQLVESLGGKMDLQIAPTYLCPDGFL